MRSIGAQPYLWQADIGVMPVPASALADWLKMTDPAQISAAVPSLQLILRGCTADAELYTKRTFYNKRFITYRDVFGDNGENPNYFGNPNYFAQPCGQNNTPICIRRTPLNTIEEITYLDVDGVWQVMDSADYRIVVSNDFSLIAPTTYWPQSKNIQQAIKITFTAGYLVLPANLYEALLVHTANAYMNRGDCGCECKNAPSESQAAYRQMRILDFAL